MNMNKKLSLSNFFRDIQSFQGLTPRDHPSLENSQDFSIVSMSPDDSDTFLVDQTVYVPESGSESGSTN